MGEALAIMFPGASETGYTSISINSSNERSKTFTSPAPGSPLDWWTGTVIDNRQTNAPRIKKTEK